MIDDNKKIFSLNNLKNLITLMAVIPPVYAVLELKPQGDDFTTLTEVTAPNIISGAVSLVLIVTIVVFFFILTLGAFKWITSGGDEKKVAAARSQITNALIGLVLIFSVWAILNFVETIFNIKILDGFSIPNFTGSSSNNGLIEKSH